MTTGVLIYARCLAMPETKPVYAALAQGAAHATAVLIRIEYLGEDIRWPFKPVGMRFVSHDGW